MMDDLFSVEWSRVQELLLESGESVARMRLALEPLRARYADLDVNEWQALIDPVLTDIMDRWVAMLRDWIERGRLPQDHPEAPALDWRARLALERLGDMSWQQVELEGDPPDEPTPGD